MKNPIRFSVNVVFFLGLIRHTATIKWYLIQLLRPQPCLVVSVKKSKEFMISRHRKIICSFRCQVEL